MVSLKIKIDENLLELPEIKKLFGKEVTLFINEKSNDKKYSRFFGLAGKIDIDKDAVNDLRKNSYI